MITLLIRTALYCAVISSAVVPCVVYSCRFSCCCFSRMCWLFVVIPCIFAVLFWFHYFRIIYLIFGTYINLFIYLSNRLCIYFKYFSLCCRRVVNVIFAVLYIFYRVVHIICAVLSIYFLYIFWIYFSPQKTQKTKILNEKYFAPYYLYVFHRVV